MKRLILMGGRPWLGEDKGKAFVSTLFRYYLPQVKVGFCIFAQPENDWDETVRVSLEMFETHKGDRSIEHRVMTKQNFTEVSAWADVIYIPGGDPFRLKEAVLTGGDIRIIWDNKTIGGSSAGADLFCKGFAYLQDKTFGQGLGWVEAACIPHWRSNFNSYTDADWDWAEQESLRQHPDLPVLTLSESQFIELTLK